MANRYWLDNTAIPRPNTFIRTPIFQKTDMTTIDGKTSRDLSQSKEKYTLGWEMLTEEDADSIVAIVEKNQVVNFKVEEADLFIREVLVWPYVASRSYTIKGEDYLVSLMLELIEEKDK